MPCFNPSNDWHKNIVSCYSSISILLELDTIHLIIVNDGSQKKILQEEIAYIASHIKNFTFVNHQENNGKGFAVRSGAELAKTDYVIYTDIDFPYKEEDLVKMYFKIIDQKADLIIGIRKDNYYNEIPYVRKKISLWYKKLLKKFLNIPTTDTQAGLKALSKNAVEQLILCKTNGYLFDLELIRRCAEKSLIILESEIRLKPNIVMRKMPLGLLTKEFFNLIRIAFARY